MATAQTIITRAFRLLGVIDSGTAPTAGESTDAMQALNDLLADWALQPLLQYSTTQESYAVSSSITSLSIGPTGAKVTTRPDQVKDLFLRVGSVDYPIEQIGESEYKAISFKSVSGGYPSLAWYDPEMSNGTLYLWPGAASGQTLFWDSVRPIQTFALITDTLTAFPPNYLRALAYNLAVEIGPEYGFEASPTVQRIAATSKRGIKQSNALAPHLACEASGLSSNSSRINIVTNQ